MPLEKIIHFLKHDLWHIRPGTLSPKKLFLIRQIRIIVLAFKGFDEDRCGFRASALTFYSLLSLPFAAALAFGIAKGFGIQKLLEKELLEKMKGQEEAVMYIITFANKALNESKGGLIAGIGIAALFFLIIKLLGNIETSFNDIWGVPHSRPLGRKLTDYLSVLFVAPILFIMSSSITVFITTQLTNITQRIGLLGPISSVILFSLKALPYCMIWLLFTFVYIFMPNTKVHFRSGLLGGIVSGTIYTLVQWLYITFQIGVSKYGAIYGSFSVLPLFMIWLQMSWLIVLFGAEISFAHQNVETYEFEPVSLGVSPSFKRLLALRIVHLCIKNFLNGNEPWTGKEISNTMGIPIRLTNQIVNDLVQCHILSETVGADGIEPLYQPARDINSMSIFFIIKAFDELGNDDIPLIHSEEIDRISRCIEEFTAIINNSDANMLLKDI